MNCEDCLDQKPLYTLYKYHLHLFRISLYSPLVLSLSLGLSGPAWSQDAVTAQVDQAAQADSNDQRVEELVFIQGNRLPQAEITRLPMDLHELPQSVSEVSRDLMDLTSLLDIDDVMMNLTGINVSLYDSQRPLYFSRGFQITDFQVDGVPTYSGSTNQEYDTALYERVEVIRGANGLITGVGTPSASVNLIRKRPKSEFDASLAATVGSWNMRRGVGDISMPLTSDGRVRSRLVVAYQDSDNFRDRYSEDKTAMLGVVEADVAKDTTVSLGYQNQDNNPTGTIWGTIPIFAADGSEAKLPVSTSFAPRWTEWQRESGTLFADVKHRFGRNWTLQAMFNSTKGEVSSLRVYAHGYPDPTTGQGLTLLAGVGAGEDTRKSLDLYLTGSFSAWGRDHSVVLGANGSQLEAYTPLFTSVAGWSYDVPNAWDYDGEAPKPEYSKTGAYRIAATEQAGVYTALRLRATDALSLVAGGRITSWKTATENFDITGRYTETTGAYEVKNEVTPYTGVIYEFTRRTSMYLSYTDIFSPQNFKDRDDNLLEPVLGSNLEAGLKSNYFDGQLAANFAIFKTTQDNYAVRDLSQPENSLPDGSSAYIGVDGTESDGFELGLSGTVNDSWTINAGYTFVDTNRNENDKIWTNLPEHAVQMSIHYRLPGALRDLTLGGGINWRSEIVGYGLAHPLVEDGVTFEQGSYALANLYGTWEFNEAISATLSATNLFDRVYWANIDYANYGEPRNISMTLRWQL